MPRLTDLDTVRALLEADRPWAAYALGDLAPGFSEHAEWYLSPQGEGREPALALLFRGFPPPVLILFGPPEPVTALLDDLAPEPVVYLNARPDLMPLLRDHYRLEKVTPMWRMLLDPGFPLPPAEPGTTRLRLADLPALQALYADGDPTGEAPDFFYPSMLEQGVFYGIWDGNELIAAAGTHLVAPAEGVGTIGNIYTRRDRRGQGLGGRLTRAVAAELRRTGLATIVLNVSQANAPALRAYERAGFTPHCPYFEALATHR
jgi:GNAT superfamily N-acetyltransferase